MALEMSFQSVPSRTFDKVHELQYPLLVAMRIIDASRDQDGIYIVRDLVCSGYPPAIRFDAVLHLSFNAQLRVMLLISLAKQIVQYLAKGTLLLLGVGMRLIRFQN